MGDHHSLGIRCWLDSIYPANPLHQSTEADAIAQCNRTGCSSCCVGGVGGESGVEGVED